MNGTLRCFLIGSALVLWMTGFLYAGILSGNALQKQVSPDGIDSRPGILPHNGNGNIARTSDLKGRPVVESGGGRLFENYDMDNAQLWECESADSNQQLQYDVVITKGGEILLVVWERTGEGGAVVAEPNQSHKTGDELEVTRIIEVDSTGASGNESI